MVSLNKIYRKETDITCKITKVFVIAQMFLIEKVLETIDSLYYSIDIKYQLS